MTLDLSKINRIALEAVRQARGRFNPADSSDDVRIASMTPRQFVAMYTQWWLGDPAWGRKLYDLVHEVDAAEKQDHAQDRLAEVELDFGMSNVSRTEVLWLIAEVKRLRAERDQLAVDFRRGAWKLPASLKTRSD